MTAPNPFADLPQPDSKPKEAPKPAPVVARPKSQKKLDERLWAAANKVNATQFLALLEEGANWKSDLVDEPFPLEFVISTMPLSCLQALESRGLDLGALPEPVQRGFDDYLQEYPQSDQSVLAPAMENPDPAVLAYLLKNPDHQTSANLWTHLMEYGSAANVVWFFEKEGPLFPPELTEQNDPTFTTGWTRVVHELVRYHASRVDPKDVFNRINQNHPDLIEFLKTPETAARVWGDSMTLPTSGKGTERGIHLLFPTLTRLGIHPPLTCPEAPHGWVWQAIREGQKGVANWLCKSEGLFSQAVACMHEDFEKTAGEAISADKDSFLKLALSRQMDASMARGKNGKNILHLLFGSAFPCLSADLFEFSKRHVGLLGTPDKQGNMPLESNARVGIANLPPRLLPDSLQSKSPARHLNIPAFLVWMEQFNLTRALPPATHQATPAHRL
jgi:hypothetical protein